MSWPLREHGGRRGRDRLSDGPDDKYMARLYIQQARVFRQRGLHSAAVLFQRWAMVRRCRARTPAKSQGELFPEAA